MSYDVLADVIIRVIYWR